MRVLTAAVMLVTMMGCNGGSEDDELRKDLKAANATIDSLMSRVEALELETRPLLDVVSVKGHDVTFSGVNVHIESGSGATDDDGSLTGLGNLIVGYDEGSGFKKSGSHNLVLGIDNRYTSYAGIVSGNTNTVEAPFACAIAGLGNVVSGGGAASIGGFDNLVSGEGAASSGGEGGIASGSTAAIAGGTGNQATGEWAFMGGGAGGVAEGGWAVVLGGNRGVALRNWSVVLGGREGVAAADYAVVAGGLSNTVTTEYGTSPY